MAFDSAALRAITSELEKKIVSGRINKVYQSLHGEVTLVIRGMKENIHLLISANPASPRLHITESPRETLSVPPNFCMVLRKYIEGGKIIAVSQVSFERILRLEIESRNEIGNLARYVLVAEIMGKHSNIILVDSGEKIIDCLKHISSSLSRYRELLPNRPYFPPPYQGRRNPLNTGLDELNDIAAKAEPTASVETIISASFMGISPLLMREISYRAGVLPATLWGEMTDEKKEALIYAFAELSQDILHHNFEYCIFYDNKGKRDFSVYNLRHIPEKEKDFYTSPNKMCDFFYLHSLGEKAFATRQRELIRVVENHLAKIAKRLEKQAENILTPEELKELRIKGEHLFAHLHEIQPGTAEVTLQNFYEPGNSKIKIALNPHWTPAKNAQSYFKQYNKAQNAANVFSAIREKAKTEQEYLESLLVSLQNAENENDLTAIQIEMGEEGYLRVSKKKDKKQNQEERFLKFISPDGLIIIAGKNNRQNELLSLKIAKNEDWWFHTKNIPGSHVIVRSQDPELPLATLKAAATIAAYYSKARESTNVPVDYTLCKYVRKAKGTPPGMVIYENHKTINVNPDADFVNSLTETKK